MRHTRFALVACFALAVLPCPIAVVHATPDEDNVLKGLSRGAQDLAENQSAQSPDETKRYIDIPDMCHTIAGIEDNRIYLQPPEEPCSFPGAGRALVTIDPQVEEVEIYVGEELWSKQRPLSYGARSTASLMRDAMEAKKRLNLQIPENKEAEDAAQQVYDYVKSEEFQGKLKLDSIRIEAMQQGRDPDQAVAESQRQQDEDEPNRTKPRPGNLAADERVYLFISKSIPLPTLRAYAESIHAAGEPNIIMVLRGMVGGISKIGPTLEFMRTFISQDADCPAAGDDVNCEAYNLNVIIDPLLFRRYNVTAVPTFVFAREVEWVFGPAGTPGTGTYGSEGLPDKATVGSYFVASGDVALDHALEVLNRDAQSPTLDNTISAMRAGFYR